MPMAPLIWGSVEGQWPSPESWGRGLVTPSLRLELMIKSVMFIMVNCILILPHPFQGWGIIIAQTDHCICIIYAFML